MDLLAESVEAGTRLVQQVMRTAQDQNLASVALWLALSLPQHRALEKLGFRPDAPVTYAGARPLLDELREMIGNPAAWRFSMGDSDVY
jgi:hypothetical protein